MTDEIETILRFEEVQSLLEGAELSGVVQRPELNEFVAALELEPAQTEELVCELERRGIELVERLEPEEKRPADRSSDEPSTDALQLFLREAGRRPLLNAAQRGRAGEADRQGKGRTS